MIVTKDEVQRIYRRRFSEEDKKAKSAVWKVLVESFFQRWVAPGNVVVDLGCGYGEFLNYLRCSRRIGVDLNPDSQSHLAPGIEFHQQSVCDLSFLPDNSVDVVFTSNLMEHLPSKREVEQMAKEALRVLRLGGHFIMMGPNLRLLPGTYWDFWDHVVPITDRSLVECLENLEFQIADCHPRFLPYTTRSSLPQAPSLVRLYVSMPWAWNIFGKQFLIRARKTPPSESLTSVVLPVYNESENIVPCVQRLTSALHDLPHEILVCYDFDEDATLPALAAMPDRPPTVRLVKNTLGRGVAFALQAGFNAAHGDVIVSSMADLSDPPEVIPQMAAKIRAGADVVSGSRYMKGGSQHGGPLLKRTLSRLAGLSLRYIAGVRTHDATTNFRAYSAEFLHTHPIESTAGFEVALELTTKAHRDGAVVDEVPSSWHDRTAGESRFNLKKWLPKYLYWYFKSMAQPLFIWASLAVMLFAWMFSIHKYGTNWPFWDELSYLQYVVGAKPITWDMLWATHNGHRILIPKLIYIGIMKASRYQPLAVVYLNPFFLIFGILCIIFALRSARGRMRWMDAAVIFAVLAFSQYENLLWAFQLTLILSASLILIIIAAATAIRDRTDRLMILVIGAATALLPFCGGQGMSTAPGFFLWLLGVGLIYLIRGKDRADRRFAIYSLASGAVAAAAWCISVHGLPPSPAAQSLHEMFQSWSAFSSSVSRLYVTTLELFSTPFLPESMNSYLPFFYRGRTWGVFSLLLFLSAALILLASWIRRPKERLRISAISACMVAFVLLTLILYLSRGVYGPGAGAVGRYSTVAMPLLVIVIVAYLLYAPRLIRAAIPFVIAVATVFLLYGIHGNLQKLRDFTDLERTGYRDFKHELQRPGGTTIEELAAHFEAPLYAPGDSRPVPEFIQLMADHHVGPFRGNHVVPPHIASWQASPLELHFISANYSTWNGASALKSADVTSWLTFALDKPTPLFALRLTFRVKSPTQDSVLISVAHYQSGISLPDPNHHARLALIPSDTETQIATFYIFSTVDRIDVNLGAGVTQWDLLKCERLEPAAAHDAAPAVQARQ